jgi:hypothetical protein
MKRIICAIGFAAYILRLVPCLANTMTYAIVVGNNAPPSESDLPVLRYADDDAIRYYNFFRRFSGNVHLLTIPDQQTQKRYPGIGDAAETPTLDNLKKTIKTLKSKIQAAEEQGRKTTFYFAYSGHGNYAANGEPFLTFMDGGMTGKTLYDDILADLKTDYQHVFIDACYAEGIVGFRGPFDVEVNGDTTNVNYEEKNKAFGLRDPTAYPGLGIIISSAKFEKTHEWSRFESGVFTHEVLSGLSGPADINLDGKIEYSELVAFISVANLEVTDSRGKIEVIAKPPARNHNVPIVDLMSLKDVAFIVGDPSELGHFSIELQNGLRYLDANLAGMKDTFIAIPLNMKAYLQTASKEAQVHAGSSRVIHLAKLDLKRKAISSRGNIDDALQNGLFSATYGLAFYQGFVNSAGFICVNLNAKQLNVESGIFAKAIKREDNVTHKTLAIASFALASAAAVSAVSFGAVALSAKKKYNDIEYASTETENLNERYMRFGTATWVAVGIIPVAALTGLLLWPDKPTPPVTVGAITGAGDTSLLLSVTF